MPSNQLQKHREKEQSRFPGTEVFRRNADTFMVSNGFVSAIEPSHAAVFCPLRGCLVQASSCRVGPKRNCPTLTFPAEPLLPSSVPEDQVCWDKGLKWTEMELVEHLSASQQNFQPARVAVKRSRYSPAGVGRDNILGSTEVGFTAEAGLLVPVFCPLEYGPQIFQATGVRAIPDGETIPCYSPEPFPVISVTVAPRYAQDYLLSPSSLSSGVYLERHCTPHLHRPVSASSCGAVVIAREIYLSVSETGCEHLFDIFAVSVPSGYTLFTPAMTWHNDCFLQGSFEVGYAVASSNETLVLAHQKKRNS